MIATEAGQHRIGREGLFARARRALTEVKPRSIHIDSLAAEVSKNIEATKQVPAGEWDDFHKIVAGINRGAPDMVVAQGFLISWKVDSLMSLKRSDRVGNPYTLTANPGLMHIATDVILPNGAPGVQINIEKAKTPLSSDVRAARPTRSAFHMRKK